MDPFDIPFTTPDIIHMTAELNKLRRACRAMAGIDVDTSVTPTDMKRVMTKRGWVLVSWLGDPNRVLFESYDHSTAICEKEGVLAVLVPLHVEDKGYSTRVRDWAIAMSRRHGDVSPSEVLAEAM